MFYTSKLVTNSLEQAIKKVNVKNGYSNLVKNQNHNDCLDKNSLNQLKSNEKFTQSYLLYNNKEYKKLKNSYQTKLNYVFSSTASRQSSSLVNINEQQVNNDSVIQVKTQQQQLLFIDSNTLYSNIIKQQLRQKIKQNNKYIYNKGSIQNQNQIQLNLFQQLNKKAISITEYNQYLAKGQFQNYKDYPIVKLTEICLRLIKIHNTNNTPLDKLYNNINPIQHWKSLQYFIRKRMHNCSVKDYMKILYITLNSYNNIYKFSYQFMDSLIKGMKQEITLMEQQQLMQLYVMLSQSNLQGRQQYQLSLKYSNKYQTQQKLNSPYYQNELLYKLQQEIIQKIVKKYQKKYLKTQLSLKQQDMIKIVWWLKSILLYQNSKFTLLKGNINTNEGKNKYVVGLVNVLLKKVLKLEEQQIINSNQKLLIGSTQLNNKGKNITSNNNNTSNKSNNNINNKTLLQNKSMKFNSSYQLIQFLSTLSLVRDYLKQQGENENKTIINSSLSGSVYSNNNNKLKQHELLNKNSIWLEKSNYINQLMLTVISYDNVNNIILGMFNDDINNKISNGYEQQLPLQQIQQVVNQVNANNDNNVKQEQHKVNSNMNKQTNRQLQTLNKLYQMISRYQMLKLISQCKQYQQNSKLINQWCIQLNNKYNIFQLFQQTYQFLINIKDIKKQIVQQQQQSNKQTNEVQNNKLLVNKIGLYQLQLLYLMYNNIYYVNKMNKVEQLSTQQDNNSRYNLNNIYHCYQHIIQTCFLNQQQSKQSSISQQQHHSLLNQLNILQVIPSSTILKLINLQISFSQIHKQISYINNIDSDNNKIYKGYKLVKRYAQDMLNLIDQGSNYNNNEEVSNNNENNSIKKNNTKHSFYIRQLQLPIYTYLALTLKHTILTQQQTNSILTILQTIKSRNIKAKLYLQQHNLQYIQLTNTNNTQHNPFINSTGYLPHKNNSLLIIKENKSLSSNQYDKQSVLLGEYVMRCINKQKKRYLHNQQILKLTKFFTQIKAFNQLKFSHPITNFLITPQFVFNINNNKKVNNINNINNNLPPKVLMFLSKQEIIKPQIISQKVIYQTLGMQMIVIDRKQFLNMHINQRIQKLNQILFTKSKFNHVKYLIDQ